MKSRLRFVLPAALLVIALSAWFLVRSLASPDPEREPAPPDPVPVTPPPPTEALLLPLVPDFAPPDADAVAIVRSARSLLTDLGFADLSQSPSGAAIAGVLMMELGFDPTSPDALASQGLDPDRPIALSSRADGLLLLWLPATDAKKLTGRIEELLEVSGGGDDAPTDDPAGLVDSKPQPLVAGGYEGALYDATGPFPMAILAGTDRVLLVMPPSLWTDRATPGSVSPAEGLGAALSAIATGAGAWKERLAPMAGQETPSALVLMWTAAVDIEEPLLLGRTGDPTMDALIMLAERFATTPAFYHEGDAMVTLASPGNGLRLDTYSRVTNEEQARALLSGACRVDALMAAMGTGGAMRGAGVLRANEVELLTGVAHALPLPQVASTVVKLDEAYTRSGLGRSMWDADERLRCIGVSAGGSLEEVLLALEVGEGPDVATAVDLLFSGVIDALAPELPRPTRVAGAERPTWTAPGGVQCALQGPLLLCGGTMAVARAIERLREAPADPRPASIFRLEADLPRFGEVALASFGGAADGRVLRAMLDVVGTMTQTEELTDGGARMSLTFSGGDRPMLRALLLPEPP